MRDFAAWVEKHDAFDPMRGIPRLGDCTADHRWWDDECWYTDDEKDEMQANAYWNRLLSPRRPFAQTKVEWGQSYSPDLTP